MMNITKPQVFVSKLCREWDNEEEALAGLDERIRMGVEVFD